jgi:ABC-type Fe3+/spermidine/putrescine transport system ATPase subunit
MSSRGDALFFRDITRSYSNFFLQASFHVNPGEIVSLLGPSGSGKTTCLRIIAGFEKVDSGSVEYGGIDITNKDPAKRNFGFVPQDQVLFPHLNVARNISYGLNARKMNGREAAARVTELLNMLGLPGYEFRRVQTLSGGEQQRVALARALATGPGILLLDEPFSALDTPLRRELRDELIRIKNEMGISIIFVTHSQDEALSISDRIVLMQNGHVVQTGIPEELFGNPVNEFAAGFLGVANIISAEVTRYEREMVILNGEFSMHIKSHLSSAKPKPGRAKVLVRPFSFSFAEGPGLNTAAVVIESRKYLGDRYEYRCVSSNAVFVVVEEKRAEVGSRGYIQFDPADGYILS